MAKANTFQPTFPEFKMPEFKMPELHLPKFHLDALFALQNANLAAAHEVQTIVLEAIQGIAKVQHGWIQESVESVKGALSGKEPKEPQALIAGLKTATDKAVAVGKQGMDLSVAAQQRVAELVAKRVQASMDELKAIAA
jgi:hypothetical protein